MSSAQYDGPRVNPGSVWKPRTGKIDKYTVLSSDYDGVVASTAVRVNTMAEDSFIWFSPLEDFLNQFILVTNNP